MRASCSRTRRTPGNSFGLDLAGLAFGNKVESRLVDLNLLDVIPVAVILAGDIGVHASEKATLTLKSQAPRFVIGLSVGTVVVVNIVAGLHLCRRSRSASATSTATATWTASTPTS